MFITKKHISRRTFLSGTGVTLALPFLEAMVPALTAQAQTAAAPVKRFVGIWHPHGAVPISSSLSLPSRLNRSVIALS